MSFRAALIAALVIFAVPVQSTESRAAESGLLPVEHFAKLPLARDIKLSPDGNFYAGIMTLDGTPVFAIIPTNGSSEGVQLVNYGDLTPGFWRWAGNRYIVLEVSIPTHRFGTKSVETRLARIDAQTGEIQNALKINRSGNQGRNKHYPQFQSTVVSYLIDDDQHILMELDADRAFESDVVKVDLETGTFKKVERYRVGTRSWLADAAGNVRLGFGYSIKSTGEYSDDFKVLFRADGESDFIHVEALEDAENPYSPIGFTEDPHIILVAARNEHNRKSIYEYDVRTDEITKTVFSHDTYDYSSFTKAAGTDRVTAVYYYADKLEAHYLDADIEAEAESLARLFDGYNARVISRDKSGNKLIVWTGKENLPSKYYYIDLNTGSAAELSATYPGLEGMALATPMPIRYAASDGLEISGYLTLPAGSDGKNLPMIVHPHGGPASRDTLRFDYWVQYFTSRGWAVLQMNFRGSTGFGRDFEDKGRNQWGQAMQDDITDGAQWVVDQGIADPERMCIVGGSYGGYAAIQAMVKTPDFFKCAVALNGLFDIQTDLQRSRRYVGSQKYKKYMQQENASEISPSRHVEKIKSPVMIAYGEDDRNVDEEQSKDLISKLKRAKKDYVALKLKDGRHGLNSESNRLQFFREMDEFLQEHLGLGQVPDYGSTQAGQ